MAKKPIVQVRLTTVDDLSYIENWLSDKETLKGFPMFNQSEIKDSVSFWGQHIEHNMSITALHNNKVAGCANLYIQSVKKLSHQCLFVIIVSPKYRGKGIGLILMKALEKRAKEQFKIELLHLEVYEHNPAIGFYEKLGFKHYGRHQQYLKEPDGTYYDKFLMQKFI